MNIQFLTLNICFGFIVEVQTVGNHATVQVKSVTSAQSMWRGLVVNMVLFALKAFTCVYYWLLALRIIFQSVLRRSENINACVVSTVEILTQQG